MARAPRSLRLFAVVFAASVLFAAGSTVFMSDEGELAVALAGILMALSLAAGLTALVLRGSRIAWSLLTVGVLFDLVTVPFSSGPLWAVVPLTIDLICLLAPSARRYVWAVRSPLASSHGA